MDRQYSEINSAECCGTKMQYAGLMYAGSLWDSILVKKMLCNAQKDNIYSDAEKLLAILTEEAKVDCQWHYNLHAMAKKFKLKIPKTEYLLEKIKGAGHTASRTHFSDKGIRTDMPLKELVSMLSVFSQQ